MADQHPLAQRTLGMQRLQGRQRRRLFFEDLLGQDMAFHLHLAEHHLQGTDEVRNAMGQGQVDQFNLGRYGQAGITDDHLVAMAQGSDQP
ncbi:hypothetical protein D3C78_1549670 [compost metagenome]